MTMMTIAMKKYVYIYIDIKKKMKKKKKMMICRSEKMVMFQIANRSPEDPEAGLGASNCAFENPFVMTGLEGIKMIDEG